MVEAIAPGVPEPVWKFQGEAGRVPLGGLLHQSQIPFESRPIQFVAVATAARPAALRAVLSRPICFGRLNHLSKPDGVPRAWIMEILPP